MTFACLLRLQCENGEIQIMVGSDDGHTMRGLNQLSKTISTKNSLQTKVTEILNFVDASNIDSAVEAIDDDCDVDDENDDIVISRMLMFFENEQNKDNYHEIHELDDTETSQTEGNTTSLVTQPATEPPTNQSKIARKHYTRKSAATKESTATSDYELVKWEISDSADIDIEHGADDIIVTAGKKNISEAFIMEDTKDGTIETIIDVQRQTSYAKFLQEVIDECLYRCTICEATFGEKSSIVGHVRKEHSGDDASDIYGCKLCLKSFDDVNSLPIHFGTHKLPFYCAEHCTKRFCNVFGLRSHLRKVHGLFNFSCKICGLRAVNKYEVKKHVLMCHKKGGPSFKCIACNEQFTAKRDLVRHVSAMHKTIYKCDVCEMTFDIRRNLKRHILTHHNTTPRPNVCNVCGKTYMEMKHLRTHMRRFHPNATGNVTSVMIGMDDS